MMRIVFMGTPDFAVPSLNQLIQDGHEIVGVYTQPDKPKNRGMKLTPPPVKVVAQANHLPVFQPKTLKDEAVQQELAALAPELIVVAAYGKAAAQGRAGSCPKRAVSTSTPPCCPSIGARHPSTGHAQRRRGDRRDHHAHGGSAGRR